MQPNHDNHNQFQLRKFAGPVIERIKEDLNTTHWLLIIDINPNADPQNNDNNFCEKIDEFMKRHFPLKKVKHNKYKHKKM